MDADRAALSRGRALLDAGQAEAALEIFAGILSSSPDDFDALCGAASAEIDLKRGPDAVAHAQAAIKLHPEAELPLRLLAYALMVDQKLGPARDAAQRALELDPNSWVTHYTRAAVDVEGKLLSPQSIYSAEEAVTLAPNEPSARVLWGRVLRMDHDAAGAEEQFRAALRLDPNNRAALFNLGISKLRKGDHEGASSVFVDFAATDPGSKAAVFNLRVSAGRTLRLLTWLLLVLTGACWIIALSISLSHDPTAGDRAHIPLIVLTALDLVAIVASIVSLKRAVGARFGRFVTGVVRVDRLLTLWAIILLAVLVLCVVGVFVAVGAAAWVYFAAVLATLGAKYTESERARSMNKERLRLGG